MSALAPDPAWRALRQPGGLVLHAGADLSYLLPDVPDAEARAVVDVLAGRADPDRLGPAMRLQLRSLGALRPADLPTRRPPAVGVRVVGAEPARLRGHFPGHPEPDLVLVVRTTGTLADLADLREHRPHLLLDLAHHHTAALGPLVVPGASACLGCLTVRARRRWSDPEPPPTPAATTADLPFHWARHAIDRLVGGSLALLDRVVTLNLDEFTTTAEDVLPSADCETCPRFDTGRVDLPWDDTGGISDDNRAPLA